MVALASVTTVTASSDAYTWKADVEGDWANVANWLTNGVQATELPGNAGGNRDTCSIITGTAISSENVSNYRLQLSAPISNALKTAAFIISGGTFTTGGLNIGNDANTKGQVTAAC